MRLIIISPFRFDNLETAKNYINILFEPINDLYDSIFIIARIKDTKITKFQKKKKKIFKLNKKLFIYSITFYHGPNELVKKAPNLIYDILKISKLFKKDIFVFRGTDVVSLILGFLFYIQRKPWGIQLIGDPAEVYNKNNLNINYSFLLRKIFEFGQRFLTKKAKVVGYVSKYYLQKKYQPSKNALVFSFSDVYIPDKNLLKEPKHYLGFKEPIKLIFIGSLEQKYKGLDVLLRALVICLHKFPYIYLNVVGEGKYKLEYIKLCEKLGLSGIVKFKGFVNNVYEVIKLIDESDLFILPSFTEGLPRAMIEAMARGLPCIGTRVGGITELISKDDMVEPGNVKKLAELILDCISNPQRLMVMSERNIKKARQYTLDNMLPIKRAFYEALKKAEW
jgi:glycosyltransferase involved in cell wall biosynthesis